jgi:putative oxidoreductase
MLKDLLRNHVAPLILRLGLAVIFIYHGWEKVSQGGGTKWAGDMYPPYVQFPVAWGEFLGGIALAVGFLSRLAAAGIIVIMVGAIHQVHWAKGFSLAQSGFEYNFALIVMSAAVILLGGGALSLDYLMWRRRTAHQR